MTEKRFEIVKSKLIKDGWVISDKLKQFTFPTLKGDKRALVSYCKALNELHKENEYLHKYNTKLQKQPLLFDVQTIPDTMEIIEANNQLEKENEQLKQQEKRLYNYFRKCFNNVSEQGFCETWEVVKKYD